MSYLHIWPQIRRQRNLKIVSLSRILNNDSIRGIFHDCPSSGIRSDTIREFSKKTVWSRDPKTVRLAQGSTGPSTPNRAPITNPPPHLFLQKTSGLPNRSPSIRRPLTKSSRYKTSTGIILGKKLVSCKYFVIISFCTILFKNGYLSKKNIYLIKINK